ncbi:MAG: hypothetical protein WCH58_03915 [Candidatus Saccharibacteria bacterium]
MTTLIIIVIFVSAIILTNKYDDDDSRRRFGAYMFAGVIALLTYVIFGAPATVVGCALFIVIIILITKIIDDELNALYAIVAVYIAFLVALVYMYAWHIKA